MAQKAVFLDRDGTLIEHYDYLTEESQVKLLDRIAAPLSLLKERGYLLVVVTNQSGVARGLLTEKKLRSIHDYFRKLLAEKGVYLDGLYYCPYHPEAPVEKYRCDSDLRKPKPGMLKQAAADLDIDLAASWMIGDDDRDIHAGRSAGCRTILLEKRGSSLVRRGDAKPDYQAVNLQEAANIVLRYGATSGGGDDMPQALPSDNGKEPGVSPTPNPLSEEVQTTTSTAVMTEESSLPEASEHRSERSKRRPPDRVPPREHPPAEKIAKTSRKTILTGEQREQREDTSESGVHQPRTKTLLSQILREVKTLNRQHRYAEFSVTKLLAGITQILVLLCLGLAVVFGTGLEPRTDHVHTCLLLAAVLQTMTLTLLMMQRQ
ncbi:MAG: HAD family hydrolase [Sedimentisphaerales bacterium]|nr:HAD family hydrolase [Sedimentisphaerales bacterium]